MSHSQHFRSVGTLALALLAFPVVAEEESTTGPDFAVSKDEVPEGKRPYSPFVNTDYPDRVYWGDSHLHTSYSYDAGLVGCTLGPAEAYRFARGEQIISSSGQPVKLVRPLDWLVVADHAESMGVAVLIERSDPAILKTEIGRTTHDLYKAGKVYEAFTYFGGKVLVEGNDPLGDPEILRSVWEEIIEDAEDYYEPGKFTAFIGYEWSAMKDANNLHRVVVLRDGGEEARQVLPFAATNSDNPEDLWTWMENYEKRTGGRVLAIPHNGNLSNGTMFDVETQDGDPIDQNYARRRAEWEPLYEVTQMKGDGEAHPLLSPEDEFADYENWDRGNWDGDKKKPEMLPHEYARGALKIGLQMEQKLGVNPYKFGMVGATDAHTGLATTREDNNFGKVTLMEPGPDRWKSPIVPDPNNEGVGTYEFETIASGLQGVWARENTREALWDAMKRKETYATTGSRITVRIFAGYDFTEEDVQRPDFAKTGYLKGVPMGGDLRKAPQNASPGIMIRALRDPDGANLDRIQVIKGWLEADGTLAEKVYDVAVSDGREIDPETGRCKTPVGSTVDTDKATFTNNIGDALLMGFWEDPDFDPKERAFYYVRVLEIPTPRWTTHDAVFYGLELPEGVPAVQQDRAYTSPVWYNP